MSDETEKKDLLSSLSLSDIFELGWDLRKSLSGHVLDGRDVHRAFLSNDVLIKYSDIISRDWTCSPSLAIAKVKIAIKSDLLQIDKK